jgi:putative lipoprotein
MDVAATAISSLTFTTGSELPLCFELDYDESKIKESSRYSVGARIESKDGKLRFITDTHNGVITEPKKTHHLDLRLITIEK